jgi:hypothetical protein
METALTSQSKPKDISFSVALPKPNPLRDRIVSIATWIGSTGILCCRQDCRKRSVNLARLISTPTKLFSHALFAGYAVFIGLTAYHQFGLTQRLPAILIA